MTSQTGQFENDKKGPEKRTLLGWVQNDLGASFSNAVEQDIFDPLKNFANDIDWLANGGKSKPAKSTEKPKTEPSDFVGKSTDFFVHGSVSAVTYSVAGLLTQTVGKKFGTAFKLGESAIKVLSNKTVGNVVGAGVHDFYLNADNMQGRLANAAGGATTMLMYDGANHLLPAKYRFTKIAAQPVIGAGSAVGGYYASTLVAGKEINQSDLLNASGEGAAFGATFPLAQMALGKFGKFQLRGRHGEASAHTSAEAPTSRKTALLQGKIERNFVVDNGKSADAGTFKLKEPFKLSSVEPIENKTRSLKTQEPQSNNVEGKVEPKTQPKAEPKVELKAEPKTSEQKIAEAETRKVDAKEVEVKETETRKADAKEVEVKETETRKADAKEVEVKETETRKADAKEVEVKETETRKADAKEVEVKETETRKADAKEVEVKETETRKAEAIEVEVKETETRKAEAIEVEVKETETRKAEAKEVEVKETETRKADAKEAEVKDAQIEIAGAKESSVSEAYVKNTEAVEIGDQTTVVAAESQVAEAVEAIEAKAVADVETANPFSVERIAAFESQFGIKGDSKFDFKIESKYGQPSYGPGVEAKFTSYALPFTAAGGSIVAAHSATSSDDIIVAGDANSWQSLFEERQYEKFSKQLPDWMNELGFRVGLFSPPSEATEVVATQIHPAFRRLRLTPAQPTPSFTRIVTPSFSQTLRAVDRGHSLRGPNIGMSGVLGGFDADTLAQYDELKGAMPDLFGSSKSSSATSAVAREAMVRRFPFLSQDSRHQSALSYSVENAESANVGIMGSAGAVNNDPATPDPAMHDPAMHDPAMRDPGVLSSVAAQPVQSTKQ